MKQTDCFIFAPNSDTMWMKSRMHVKDKFIHNLFLKIAGATKNPNLVIYTYFKATPANKK